MEAIAGTIISVDVFVLDDNLFLVKSTIVYTITFFLTTLCKIQKSRLQFVLTRV